ncbi:MAG TPA: hypothetical protein VNW97_05575 [Candidatus Saccharimonadales bacterium]|jgi:hypothetical protein|nr:hypothetical protein [Candidatus Saccharimonadales bacterium]
MKELTEEHFKKALAAAEDELDDVECEIVEKEKRREELRQAIILLKKLLGREGEDAEEEGSLTDKIMLTLPLFPEKLGVQEIQTAIGLYAKTAPKLSSVATILNRLAREGKIEQGRTADDRVGYSHPAHVVSKRTRPISKKPLSSRSTRQIPK